MMNKLDLKEIRFSVRGSYLRRYRRCLVHILCVYSVLVTIVYLVDKFGLLVDK